MATDMLAQQRAWFREARSALAHHDLARVVQLRTRLEGYPLAPYLDIRLAGVRMAEGSDAGVAEVIARYREIPDARDLHLAWIRDLAHRGQWPMVAEQLRKLPSAALRMPEIAIQSAFYTGRRDEAYRLFSGFWRQGKRVPKALNGIVRSWQQAGFPSQAMRWDRVVHLMERHHWQQARRLLSLLPAMDRQLVLHWHQGWRQSARVLRDWPVPARASEHEARVLRALLRRLSREDVLSAWRQAHRLRLAFSAEDRAVLLRRIALRAARRQKDVAVSWLEELPDRVQNDETRGWRVRLLLQRGDWQAVAQAIAALPPQQRHQPEWAYWQARAMERLGYREEAGVLFSVLAQGRGYFAFLSAERLHIPYQIDAHGEAADQALLRSLERQPGIRRAYEWLQLGIQSKARREWFRALQGMTPEKWRAAAQLAYRWHWFDRAVLAALRAHDMDALDLRFPLAYELQVRRAAKQSSLPPSLIWSVIRQESAFNVQALSGAGARGLMQLRPRTATMVWRTMGVRRGVPDLFDAATNIRVGSRYLARVMRRFGGSVPLAVAAYNAGPSRVARWLKRQPYREGDVWVASIPFRETRGYVQHVLAYSIVYDWRQGMREPVSISKRLAGPVQVALSGRAARR